MKRIQSYALFETSEALSQDQIEFLNECVTGEWEYDGTTGLVNINGLFNCSNRGLVDFKGIRFGKVSGRFRCTNNLLTSLDGAPEEVGLSFYCDYNRLKTLKGAPRVVGGSFDCSGNELTDLKGAPREVGRDIFCSSNQLKTLEGAPEKVGGSIYCENNLLTSLEGAPVLGPFFHLYAPNNPVDPSLLEELMEDMKKNGGNFSLALRDRWDEVSLEDKMLMYRPDFKWMSAEERKELETLIAYNRIKDML
jgi:hypothetical protein